MCANIFEGDAVKIEIISSQQLAKGLRKPVIRKFEKWKLRSSFVDNISGVNLADMQLLSRFDKGIRFLQCLLTFSANTHELFF